MFRGDTDLNVNFLGNWGFLSEVSYLVFRQMGVRATHGAFTHSYISPLSAALFFKISDQNFSHLDQFLCMAFAQLTYRESLREIELACTDFRSALSLPLAGRTILQMNQTASSDQAVLWHYRKCSALLYTIQQILSLILFDKTPLD